MKKIFILAVLFTILTSALQTQFVHAYDTQIDDASKERIEAVYTLLKENTKATDAEKLDLISAYFLGTPYVAGRLVGDAETPEQLVIALNELDCFTFIDYIETFKRSNNLEEFIEQLEKVRYIDGEVTYLKRRHFFSDWLFENEVLVEDVLVQEDYTDIIQTEVVDINKGPKGEFIAGLPDREREIHFIPREEITTDVLGTLQTGDYIGLRTSIAGLDVTHCGIIIQKEDGTYMRHASSQEAYQQVIDQKLEEYFETFTKPTGILVFRSKAQFPVQKTMPIGKIVGITSGIIIFGVAIIICKNKKKA